MTAPTDNKQLSSEWQLALQDDGVVSETELAAIVQHLAPQIATRDGYCYTRGVVDGLETESLNLLLKTRDAPLADPKLFHKTLARSAHNWSMSSRLVELIETTAATMRKPVYAAYQAMCTQLNAVGTFDEMPVERILSFMNSLPDTLRPALAELMRHEGFLHKVDEQSFSPSCALRREVLEFLARY